METAGTLIIDIFLEVLNGKTLEKAMDLDVQHISTYSLTLEPDTPFERAARQGLLTLIDEAAERTMYEMARIQLQQALIIPE